MVGAGGSSSRARRTEDGAGLGWPPAARRRPGSALRAPGRAPASLSRRRSCCCCCCGSPRPWQPQRPEWARQPCAAPTGSWSRENASRGVAAGQLLHLRSPPPPLRLRLPGLGHGGEQRRRGKGRSRGRAPHLVAPAAAPHLHPGRRSGLPRRRVPWLGD